MNKKTYLQACLILPILVPVLIWFLADDPLGLFVLSLIVGGPVYVPFLICMYLWMWGKSEDEVIGIVWKSPLYFIATGTSVVFLYALLAAVTRGPFWEVIVSSIGVSIVFSAFAFFIGYFYVICFMVSAFFIYDVFGSRQRSNAQP